MKYMMTLKLSGRVCPLSILHSSRANEFILAEVRCICLLCIACRKNDMLLFAAKICMQQSERYERTVVDSLRMSLRNVSFDAHNAD